MTPPKLLAIVMLTSILFVTGDSSGPALAQATASTADDCDGAEEWLDATWERHIRAAEAMQRFIIEVQDGEPFNPEVVRSVAEDLNANVRIQTASNPPPAAEELNEMLIEVRTLHAEAMEFFTRYAISGDEEVGDQGADRTGRARQIGERLFIVADAFKVECGLTSSAAFQLPVCYGDVANRWLILTSVRLTEITNLSEIAADRLELGLPIDDQIDEMVGLRNEQVRSSVPEGAEAYQLVLLEYFDTMIELLRAAASGDQAEAERQYTELSDLVTQLAETEAAYSAPCVTGGM